MLPARKPNDLHHDVDRVCGGLLRSAELESRSRGAMRVNKSWKVPAVVTLALATSVSLAACGSSDNSGSGPKDPAKETIGRGPGPVKDPTSPTTVTFFSWGGNDPTIKNFAEEFPAQHPNITIKFENAPAEKAG